MTDVQPDILGHDRFRRSVNRAQIADLLSLVTGTDSDLYSYHEVANRLKARQAHLDWPRNTP